MSLRSVFVPPVGKTPLTDANDSSTCSSIYNNTALTNGCPIWKVSSVFNFKKLVFVMLLGAGSLDKVRIDC